MKIKRLSAMCVLLLVSTIPAFADGGLGGPKNWFHRDHTPRGPAASYYRGNHHAASHHATKHKKPHH